MYSNTESSIFECSSRTEDLFKISLKVTRSSPSEFNWRKVSKYANFKSGSCKFACVSNNMLLAQSRINFWKNSVLPIPAFPVTKTDLGIFTTLRSVSQMKISWLCLTGSPLTRPYWRKRSFLFISWSSIGFLPCCMRRLVYMSSVLAFFMVGEGKVWNSVRLFTDAFSAFVYAATAENKTRSEAFNSFVKFNFWPNVISSYFFTQAWKFCKSHACLELMFIIFCRWFFNSFFLE